MAREDIDLNIFAEDRASEVAKYVAKVMEDLEEDPVEIPITADADKAEADLKGLKDTTDDTTKSTRDLGERSDQSRSVLANMVGNSAQEMGELGGVAGSAGVAIGQMAEYAADGNIALKGMMATAVPLLAVGIAMKGIAANAERVAKARTFDKGRVEAWSEALEDGATATQAITDNLREAGTVQASIGGHLLDLTGALQAAGLSAEEYARLIAGGEEAVTSWGESMVAAGADSQAVNLIMAGARSSFDELAASEAAAATNAELFADRQAEVRDALDRATESQERATTAANDWLDAQLAAVDASFAHHDAVRDLEAAVRDTVEAQESGTATTADLEAAWRREREAALEAAGAAARLAQEQATQAGTALDAEGRSDALNNSLLESARVATPEARAQIAQYIAELNGITAEKATEIIANADTEAAARELDEAANPGAKPRPAWIVAGIDQAALANARRQFTQAIGGWGGFTMSPTNVTVNVPQGMRADDVMAAATSYARRNGGRVITRGRRR